MRSKLILALTAILILLLGSFSAENKSVRKKIEGGTIEGYKSEGVFIFKGIPFASPPVGDLRWRPPQPVIRWNGVRKCTDPPASAMQARPVPFMMWSREFMAPEEPLSEDCLYLNIWTTAKSSREKRAVIVWIHGGAFTGGSGTVPLYDGTEMARKGVVFVTINYRLGVFGFLAHPWLSEESPDKISGNYGILDQIEALKWIRKNIEIFGGDPGNVTIAGQSAGSFSVNALVVSPLARGLFHRAIGQSGGMFTRGGGLVNDLKTAESAGVQFTAKTGAESLAGLRKLPAENLIKIPGRWGIVIDNKVVLPASEAYATGKFNDVPLMTGWNADDGVSMAKPQNAVAFREASGKTYGEKAATFLSLFPAGSDEEAAESQKKVSRLFFGWQNYNWARQQEIHGNNDSWVYYFTRVPPGEPVYGAFHSAEFGYALKTLSLWNRPFKKTDHDLSETMSSYWINFARSGNPNGEGLLSWPAFKSNDPLVIEFGNEVKVISLPDRNQLEFLDSLDK